MRAKLFRWSKRLFKWMLFLILGYGTILLIGLIPVNSDFRPSPDGIKVYIVSNSVHADIIIPKTTDVRDWGETFDKAHFIADVSDETHVAIGWGDRGFFLETKTWNDFRLATAAKALLLPSESCVHVSFVSPEYYPDAVSVSISQDQFKDLVKFFDRAFKTDKNGNLIRIKGESYFKNDAFYEAHGRYHILNTCNSWVGRALKSAGVKVPMLSPMPNSPTLYFEAN